LSGLILIQQTVFFPLIFSTDSVSKDYVRLLKFGDSLYRCKALKKAALGRMATIMKRQKNSLEYLEQVRQHLSRLPAIDPNTRTLLITGFPNVGKSSFINKITRADVEVQPYAFTTKSLYIGHTDHKYLRWQVIDTPGILDHPLENRNTIEMQAITALAHIRACIVFIMDPSEQCGHSLEEQYSLFCNIRPLFNNKPILVIMNKTDICSIQDLPKEKQAIIAKFEQEGIKTVHMSTVTETGVIEAKDEACDLLLAHRVEAKLANRKVLPILNRLHVAFPQQRDNKDRPAFIPDAALARRNIVDQDENQMQVEKKLEKDLEEEQGHSYYLDLKKRYLVPDEEKYDIVPELWNGHNIADFVDADIQNKLAKLEMEESERDAAGFYNYDFEQLTEHQTDIKQLAGRIRTKRVLMKNLSTRAKRSMKPKIGRTGRTRERTVDRLRSELGKIEVELSDDEGTHYNDSVVTKQSRGLKRKREDSQGVVRSSSRTPRDQSGIRDPAKRQMAVRMGFNSQKKMAQDARKGEGDRHVYDLKPKHLFAGKRKGGKTDRR
jgi:nucleolar GTP-binding protein